MKLLHITATHLEKFGGIPVVLKNLIEEQNKIKDFEVRLLSIRVKKTGFESQYFNFLKDGETFKEYIKGYRPDIVIFHSFFYIEYVFVASYLIKNHIKYFIEPHGSFGIVANKKSRIKKKIFYATIAKQLLKNTYGFIFLNKSEKESSIFRTENDLIIPNGVRCVTESGNKNDELSFYYIGRYDIKGKGLDVLLEALKILDKGKKRYKIDFYGTGTEKQKKYIKKKINDFSYLQVKELGSVYNKQKTEMLSKYHIMLLTSRHEGFPMSVLEAWSMGNPCIITKETNVAELLKTNGLGWETEISVNSIANTIERAVQDYLSNGSSYPDVCMKFVKDNFSWEMVARQSYDILSKC